MQHSSPTVSKPIDERAEKRQKFEEERIRREEDKRQKEQERQEKRRINEEKRLERERLKEVQRLEREEKERQKEQERIKREEVKEQERLKREEQKEQERLKKEEENAKKSEEKRKKEEERLKKEEEKRKATEEKEKERQKLEEKKAKQAQFFNKFFQKSPAAPTKTLEISGSVRQQQQAQPSAAVNTNNVNTNTNASADSESDKENKDEIEPKSPTFDVEEQNQATNKKDQIILMEPDENADCSVVLVKRTETALFSPMPFQIKTNMAVAPIIRRPPLTHEETQVLDKFVNNDAEMDTSEESESTINKWKLELIERAKRGERGTSGKTEVVYGDEVDVRIVMADVIEPGKGYKRYRMKLLQFDENRRPAYWGTWKKKAAKVRGIKPYEKEEELDYEFDSDDEWEDEPEDAEEIENSDGEEEKEDAAEGEPVDEEDEEGWMVPHGYLSDSERDGEHMDIETVKSKEKEFYKSLKEQVKVGIPVIQGDNLSEFRIVFPPPSTHRIRRSHRAPKPPSQSESGPYSSSRGFLALDFPSDEEDGDYDVNKSEGDDEDSENEEDDEDSSSQSDSDDCSEDLGSDAEDNEESKDVEDMEIDEDDEEILSEKETLDSSVELEESSHVEVQGTPT